MEVHKIVPGSGEDAPFVFGGDSAYLPFWPKNPDGQDLLLLFTINCGVANELLNRSDIPVDGFLYVFSTYDTNEYFLDSITVDEIQHKRDAASYTYVVHSDTKEIIKSPLASIPRQPAFFKEASIGDGEFSVFSLLSASAPAGAQIPSSLNKSYNFLCQVYSSDFPEPFQDVLYMTDGVGYLLISKEFGGENVDGCFFVQVA